MRTTSEFSVGVELEERENRDEEVCGWCLPTTEVSDLAELDLDVESEFICQQQTSCNYFHHSWILAFKQMKR